MLGATAHRSPCSSTLPQLYMKVACYRILVHLNPNTDTHSGQPDRHCAVVKQTQTRVSVLMGDSVSQPISRRIVHVNMRCKPEPTQLQNSYSTTLTQPTLGHKYPCTYAGRAQPQRPKQNCSHDLKPKGRLSTRNIRERQATLNSARHAAGHLHHSDITARALCRGLHVRPA